MRFRVKDVRRVIREEIRANEINATLDELKDQDFVFDVMRPSSGWNRSNAGICYVKSKDEYLARNIINDMGVKVIDRETVPSRDFGLSDEETVLALYIE